jgi:Tfp pilus assembly protein PilX
MRQKGIAVVAALSLVAVMALLSLAMVHTALGSLRTGGDLLAKAQARQLAEAGLDQGIAFLVSLRPEDIPKDRVSLSGSLSTGGYQVTLRCAKAKEDPKRFDCEVRSTGKSARGTHQAKALVEVSLGERSYLKEGWFTGGKVSVNGNLSLMASRLHGDGGYTLNGATIQLCDATGKNCTSDPKALKNAVTAGLDYGVCNARGLCPPQPVCPVWGTPPANDNRPCYDSLADKMATVSTSTRIPSPDVASLYASLTGTSRDDNPYAKLAPPSCDRTIASLSDPLDPSDLTSVLASIPSGTVCLNSSVNLSPKPGSKASSLVVPAGVKLVVKGGVVVDSGASVTVKGELYVQGDWNVNSGSLSVEGGRMVVGGNVASTPQLTVNGGTLLVGGNFNVNSGKGTPTFQNALLGVRYTGAFNVPLQAEDSKLVFGSSLVFNGNKAPNLVGNTLLATTNSIIFNGSLKSNLKGSPLLVTDGDVTFNGSYQDTESASYIWAGGAVRMNGNTEYRGGIASGGGVQTSSLNDGIVVNGGLTLFRANLGNDLLPKVETLAVKVTSRR